MPVPYNKAQASYIAIPLIRLAREINLSRETKLKYGQFI